MWWASSEARNSAAAARSSGGGMPTRIELLVTTIVLAELNANGTLDQMLEELHRDTKRLKRVIQMLEATDLDSPSA